MAQPALATIENKIAIEHVVQLFHQLVVMERPPELDGVRTHDLAEVIQDLESVFDETIGAAGHTDDQP